MEEYKIEKIDDKHYLINDSQLCTTYIIIGDNKAMVIDCGMKNNESLLNQIKKITDKDLIVVLTHAHYDHSGHLDEFDHFYMAKEDEICLKKYPIHQQNKLYLKDQMEFDLGNIKVRSYVFNGHTSGSTIFIDETYHYAYTGDQFGSGCGVWMQVSEACCLSEYIINIKRFLKILESYSYPLEKWCLFGGHYGQEYTSRVSSYNPLNIEMVKNLMILSQKLIDNEVELQDSNATSFNSEKSYYAVYKNAEMVIRKSLIK